MAHDPSETVSRSEVKRRITICTPDEWRIEALARAARLTGTPEGERALVEANRYKAWSEERAFWQDRVNALNRAITTTTEEVKQITAMIRSDRGGQ